MKYFVSLLMAVLCTGLVSTVCFANDPAVKAENGIMDLRQQDLHEQSFRLHGQWHFFWKQLVPPGQPLPANDQYIPYPSLWKETRINGRLLPTYGYATYTLTVLLPKDRPQLALEIPDVYCAYKLYINDSLLARNGQPDTAKENAEPFWATQIVNLPPTGDTLHLLLQVSNFWHTKGGTYKEIIIGKRDTLVLRYHQDMAFDLLLAGCLFMGGLFFFGFFLFGRRDKAILFFSLFCIVYSYRMIGTDLYVLHAVFPHLNWFFTIRMEYLSLAVAVTLFARYIRYVYPADSHRLIMNGVVAFCLLYAVLILATPPALFTQGLTIFLGVMFMYIAYAFYVCIRAVRYNRVGARFALLSCGVMLLVFFTINLDYFGFISPPKWPVFTGYVLFFFLQSLVLSDRFASTLKQAAIEARQGYRAKSEFLSTMSHEIRTPLNVVIGMTHLMLRSAPRKDQEENLNVLLFSANNLLSIVNDILDYNKIEAGKISFEAVPMDISSIAWNIVGGLKNKAVEKQIALQLETDERLTHKVTGDTTRLSQVLYNLVHNAIKFTQQGWVRLSVKVESMDTSAVTLTFSVTDTGIGIEKEKQQMIFDRFTQADSSTSRSFGGTGLGLAITKRILELQQITLHLESEPGKGAEFYFTQTFPLSQVSSKDHQDDITKALPEKQLEGVCILVVEDNPFNVMVAQSLLEKTGAKVDVAENGAEALEKVVPGKYQLILMDLNMPVMDGFEATRQLRRRGETMPIIALTASVPSEVEKEVHAAGITDIVVKPFNPDDLFRVIMPHVQPSSV